jgi:hypothetical protein
LGLLEYVLLKVWLSFWSSAVWKVLRGYVVWHGLGTLDGLGHTHD